ncbi:hypothetical protein [Streptomyces sp. TLI_185]|uniref:hypothetical protein n=1 Tax=Streptomyces sp. TLI_185 TaxID=2485151 RepID=UPI000F9BF049|nr:hypothetical protein [Streptomyces sp. TLI_185]RPF31217.1 hypothetical protein EDD92_1049 [Streptomyces sp. TLI_185]
MVRHRDGGFNGRTASGLIARAGLIAHLVEQPAVASDAARFRLQAMADHTDDDVDTAIDILDTCIRVAGRPSPRPAEPGLTPAAGQDPFQRVPPGSRRCRDVR